MRRTISIIAAALTVATVTAGFAADVKVGGYAQARFTDVVGVTQGSAQGTKDQLKNIYGYFAPVPNIYLRRVRLNVTAVLDENARAVAEFDTAANTVSMKKAYVSYAFPELYVTVGRLVTPFGYELQQSSSAITTLDRSMASLLLIPEYVTGASFTPGSAIVPFGIKSTFTVANSGGEDAASFQDTNANKVLLADLSRVFGTRGTVGASYATDAKSNFAVGGYATGSYGKLSLTGEYLQSNFGRYVTASGFNIPMNSLSDAAAVTTGTSITRSGFYLLGNYQAWQKVGVYARFDQLAGYAEKTLTRDTLNRSRVTLGTNIVLGEATKLTAEYQIIDDANFGRIAGTNGRGPTGLFGVQLQEKF
jgi:hypothetical protein